MKKYQLQNYSIKYTRKIYNKSFHLRYTDLKYSILNTQKSAQSWIHKKFRAQSTVFDSLFSS